MYATGSKTVSVPAGGIADVLIPLQQPDGYIKTAYVYISDTSVGACVPSQLNPTYSKDYSYILLRNTTANAISDKVTATVLCIRHPY